MSTVGMQCLPGGPLHLLCPSATSRPKDSRVRMLTQVPTVAAGPEEVIDCFGKFQCHICQPETGLCPARLFVARLPVPSAVAHELIARIVVEDPLSLARLSCAGSMFCFHDFRGGGRNPSKQASPCLATQLAYGLQYPSVDNCVLGLCSSKCTLTGT